MFSRNKIRLSIVVVFYNMQREAARTLLSLSPSYQIDIDDLNYEIIVVDNGSSEPLNPETVAKFGSQYSYFYRENAETSPAAAINFGAQQARGEFLAVMIDGAHILTPGVLKYFRVATRSYNDPIVATRGWFIGPGQQGMTMLEGYNQEAEDKLFESIAWPRNGHRLFEIGELIGAMRPNWFSAIKESNCLFVRKSLFEKIGGANEAFDLPGGGYLNLDMLNECCKVPGANLVSLIGEGSFHQVHGGTTTNVTLRQRKLLLDEYRAQFERIRGEPHRLPVLPVEYVGRMNKFARLHLPEYKPPGIKSGD